MKFKKILATVAAMTAIAATNAQAQLVAPCPDGAGNLAIGASACVFNHAVTTTVNDILLLTVSTTSTGLGNPTSSNYGALAANAYLTASPLAASAGPNVKVVSNRAYEVSIAAQTATFGPAGVNKPAGDVQWKNTANSFAALATSGATVLTATTGTVDTNTNLSFQSRWAFERDVPGAYSLTLQVTLAAK